MPSNAHGIGRFAGKYFIPLLVGIVLLGVVGWHFCGPAIEWFFTSDTTGSVASLIGWIIIGLFFYFLPTYVARSRNIGSASNGVLVVNLFLGWTILGWVVALAWAASATPKPTDAAN
jgi:hypothetical protein